MTTAEKLIKNKLGLLELASYERHGTWLTNCTNEIWLKKCKSGKTRSKR